MAFHCYKHEIDHPLYDCPRCLADERHRELVDVAENAHSEAMYLADERQRASDHRRAHPGDYQCPGCRYVTLLRGAARCPTCRTDVDSRYWAAVEERETRKAAELARERQEAAERRAREEPARQRAAREAAEAERQRNAARSTAATLGVLSVLYFAYLLPIVTFLLLAAFVPAKGLWMAFVPALNWLGLLGLLLSSGGAPVVWVCFFVGAGIGVAIVLAARSAERDAG